jgi:hypothetical protein
MRTRRLLLAGLAASAVAGTAPAPAGAAKSCADTGSRAVRSTPYARVYYDSGGRPVSCYRLTGRRTVLDAQVDRFYAPGDAHLGLVRITKRILGYTWVDPGIPAVYVHSMDMRTGRFKHRVRIEPLIVIDPSAVAVPQVVVNATGAMAWIQTVEGFSSVWRYDGRGRRQLGGPDTTERITALRLRRTQLTWRQAGALRSATLL